MARPTPPPIKPIPRNPYPSKTSGVPRPGGWPTPQTRPNEFVYTPYPIPVHNSGGGRPNFPQPTTKGGR